MKRAWTLAAGGQMKRAWTLAAAVVAVAVTTAVVFADQDQSSGVIFARSRTAKYSPLVPGVSSYVAWGDTAKGPFGGFTKFRPGYDAGMHIARKGRCFIRRRSASLI